jgi:3-deoxy-manno-octulosonate cytidylyltransferase (CMP-KDO synthetase)
VKAVAVIPARMASTRFPGKPLASILGRPMIEHVYRRCACCGVLEAVVVATCDDVIRRAAEGFGARVVMTSPDHERATDRVAEAAGRLDAEFVVMVQGDEPMIVPGMIDEVLAPLHRDPAIGCVNLARRIDDPEEFHDRNTIKIVRDLEGNALYFSRGPIPSTAHSSLEYVAALRQVCVIGFTRSLLLEYSRMGPTPLERVESIDMLRLLEHGYRVRVVETDLYSHAVDTPEDRRVVESLMARDHDGGAKP